LVKVIVPATTANLGPGFDVMGLALNVYNSFTLEETEGGLEIEISKPEGLGLPADEKNLFFKSAKRLFDEVGYKYGGLRITIDTEVPLGRGLGSSSTAIVGGVVAANEVSGAGLSRDEIFSLASEIEGHPDNVGPAIFGGFTISYRSGQDQRIAKHKPSENLKPVLLIPDATLETKKARGVLPESVSLPDAVFNVSRSSLLVLAILFGKPDLLRDAMDDKLHQPYRAPLIPGLTEIIKEVSAIDGVGVALSGAGPSLVCIIDRFNEQNIYDRMVELASKKSWGYEVRPVEFDLEGTKVSKVL